MNKRKRPDRRKADRRGKRKVLVDDWKNAYKWLSVQIAALIAAAQGLIVFVPTMKEYIPAGLWHGIMATLAICVILARIKNQSPGQQKDN